MTIFCKIDINKNQYLIQNKIDCINIINAYTDSCYLFIFSVTFDRNEKFKKMC